MPLESKHARTSNGSRRLCDLMIGCLPQTLEPDRKFSATWCAAHINSRKSAIYWVSHAKHQVEVFLRSADSPEIFDSIQSKLPSGVSLRRRPHPRKGIAISTPLFFFVQTEEQARNMGPLLEMLSSREFAPKAASRKITPPYWVPNTEKEVAEFDAREEGLGVKIPVNKYERDPKNRRNCIKFYGPVCSVCGFDFSLTYGEIGDSYIHVHHLTLLSAHHGKSFRIDPVKDMRPVCPNCHEMLHRVAPPYTIEQLKNIVANAKTNRKATSD